MPLINNCVKSIFTHHFNLNKMKTKLIFYFLLLFLFVKNNISYSQIGFSPKIDSIINLSTNQTMSMLDRELSGDTATIIGGEPYTIASRYWNTTHNIKAAQYIYEKMQSYGVSVRYQSNTSTNINVVGWKTGTKYPNRQYIICAHYDDMPPGPLAPGADDNASGTCVVIEAARLLAPYTFDYTVIFIAFDEEELGMIGSIAYADSAYFRGDSILGVINLDMVAYDSNNNYIMDVITNNPSLTFANDVLTAYNIYQPVLMSTKIVSNMGGSDHASFWNRGYKAILAIEDLNDFNAYYHTVNDNFNHVNVPYFVANTRAAIAALLSFAWDYKISIVHTLLESSPDTTARVVAAIITSPQILARVTNGPRLYYKVNNGSFSYVNAFYMNQDTFKFSIPGEPVGSIVSYYLAAQDSLNEIVGTLPAGGRGINPPGTIAPSTLFSYLVSDIYYINQCSNTLPKPIFDNQTTYDTIPVATQGKIMDINVNLTIYHTYDSQLSISLKKAGVSEIDLSRGNGGSGDNYINTTFDDEASQSIIEGTPPFTGSYRPQQPLSTFDNLALNNNWILSVSDNSAGDTGQIISWCIIAQYSTTIGIIPNSQPFQYSLSQNYPNPFNASTKIDFTLPKQTNVKLIIYDVLGREVKQLLTGDIKAGEYSVYFNAAELSSGIYFYTMYFDGKHFDTKRMVIVK